MYETVPVRPGFWNVPFWAEIGVYVLALITVAVCAAGVVRVLRNHKTAAPETTPASTFSWPGFLSEVFGQSKVRQTGAGKMHAALF